MRMEKATDDLSATRLLRRRQPHHGDPRLGHQVRRPGRSRPAAATGAGRRRQRDGKVLLKAAGAGPGRGEDRRDRPRRDRPGPRAGRPMAPSTSPSARRRWTTWVSAASWCSPPFRPRSICPRTIPTSSMAASAPITGPWPISATRTHRLIAVGQVSLSDPKRALEEVVEGLKLGVGAFWIPASPAGATSPGHPDLDPIWQTAVRRQGPVRAAHRRRHARAAQGL